MSFHAASSQSAFSLTFNSGRRFLTNSNGRYPQLLGMELDVLYSCIGSPVVVANFAAFAQHIANRDLPHGADIIVSMHARLLKALDPFSLKPGDPSSQCSFVPPKLVEPAVGASDVPSVKVKPDVGPSDKQSTQSESSSSEPENSKSTSNVSPHASASMAVPQN